MDELSMDNILTGDEIDNLFLDDALQGNPPEKKDDETPDKDEKDITTEVNPDELFGEPESVGSGDNNEGIEDAGSKKTVLLLNSSLPLLKLLRRKASSLTSMMMLLRELIVPKTSEN